MRAISAAKFRGADGEMAGKGFGKRPRISTSLRRASMARPLDVAKAGARTPGGVIAKAAKEYCEDVRGGTFPSDGESYHAAQMAIEQKEAPVNSDGDW